MPPKMSSIFGRFVLQEVESQTKCCYSLKVKIFGPSQKFGLATPLETTIIKLAFFAGHSCSVLEWKKVKYERYQFIFSATSPWRLVPAENSSTSREITVLHVTFKTSWEYQLIGQLHFQPFISNIDDNIVTPNVGINYMTLKLVPSNTCLKSITCLSFS